MAVEESPATGRRLACPSLLVGQLYEAAEDSRRWDLTLTELTRCFGASGAALLVAEPMTRQITFRNVGADPEATRAYNEYYGTLDFVADAIERSPVGMVAPLSPLMDSQKNSEFYCDWARPSDFGDGLFARITAGFAAASWIWITAPRRAEVFATAARVKRLQLLLPHIQRAVHIQTSLSARLACHSLVDEIIEHLSVAAILLAGDRTVLSTNSEAAEIVARRDGPIIRAGILGATTCSADSSLRELISSACRSWHGKRRTDGSVRVPRRSGASDYVVHVVPLQRWSANPTLSEPAAVALIIDLGKDAGCSQKLLRGYFNLTDAESVVARSVQRGHGLKSVADDLSLSLATVRTHLQHVFEKTGTHRQAELVRLLWNIQLLDDAPTHSQSTS